MKTIRVQQLNKGHYIEEAYNKYGELLLKDLPVRTGDDIERMRDLGAYRLIVTGTPQGQYSTTQSPSLQFFRRAVERPDNEGEKCLALYQQLLKKVRQLMLDVETEGEYDLNSLHPYAEKLVEFSSKQQTILGLMIQAETNTYYSFEHAVNTAIIAAFYSEHKGFSHSRRLNLVLSSLLLDIGEMELPNDIILNSRDLSEEEFDEVKQHPKIGARLIEEAGMGEEIQETVAQHHERPGGGGYPQGLNEVRQSAKLAAIFDVFDALTSNRLYKQGVTPNLAFDQVWEEFQEYDSYQPLLSDFLKAMGRYPPGCIVRLSNNVIGVVVGTNPESIRRPQVKIVVDEKGNQLLHPYVVDLHTASLHRQEIDHTVYDEDVGIEDVLPLHEVMVDDLSDITEALSLGKQGERC